MNARLKKIIGMAALGMTLLANTVPSWAGYVNYPAVYIQNNGYGPYATGSMVGAHYSADSWQSIGCNLYAPASGSPSLFCYAIDGPGNYLSCLTSETKHVAEAQHMTDTSNVFFQPKAGSSACDIVFVDDSSSSLR